MITLIRDVDENREIIYEDLLIGESGKYLYNSSEFESMIKDKRVYARNNLKKGHLLEFVDLVVK